MRRSKYGNVKTVVDNIEFDSKAEAKRYGELKLLLRGGVIRDLELQPTFKLEVNGVLICKYRADFAYTENGVTVLARVVEDKKGYRTPDYKLKAKLFKALYPDVRFIET